MNLLKQKALTLIELAAGKTGYVIDITLWHHNTLIQVDLYLPDVDMSRWRQVQHIKIKVASGTYRDYTPCMWNNNASTCSLFIDTAHEGPGSSWAKNLKKDNTITYLGIGGSAHQAISSGRLLCLGDASSLGHFMALEQLSLLHNNLSGKIVLNEPQHVDEFYLHFKSWLTVSVATASKDKYTILSEWILKQPLTDSTICIAGNILLTVQLRKLIRQQKNFNGAIKAQGFWS